MARLRSALFALAALGFSMAAVLHVASFFAAVPMGSVWLLHVGAVALGIPLVATAQAHRGGRFFGPSLRELLVNAPPWGERAIQLVFLNFVLQFGALILATRTSLAADRPAPPGYEVRMFSAGWMALYLLCAFVWWKPQPRVGPTR